jgi:N-acetylglucosaminyldiphosphoundecaprenol N-acetyl-beta-D-mannosaminyltransferase
MNTILESSKATNIQPEVFELLGVQIGNLSVEELVAYLMHKLHARQRAIVCYVNVHAMNLAAELDWFREFLNRADLTYCDGFGVKWGAAILGKRIRQRYTPPDWLHLLALAAAENNYSLFLLGGHPGAAEKTANWLQERVPNLNLVKTFHGYFDKERVSSENQQVRQLINACKPDILLVGFGMPLQERWLLENWDTIDAGIALPVGALFDFISQDKWRAPRWMTDHGLEWLGRLVSEPQRMWKRYLIGNPRFLWRVLRARFQPN